MLDFKRGTIRIGEKQGLFGYIHDFSILAMLLAICFLNSGETLNTMMHYVVFGIYTFVNAIYITKRIIDEKRYKIPLSLIWYGLFTVFAISSYAWATNPDSVLTRFRMLIEVLVVSFGIATYIDTKEKLYRFFNILCTAIFILSLVILIKTPFNNWIEGFNNNEIIAGLNINAASQMMTVCVMVCFYLAYVEQKRLYYFPLFFFALLAFFSGSRKAFLMVALAFVMIIVLNFGKKKYFLNLCIIIAIIVAIVIATLKIPVLYNAFGYRIESMIGHFFLEIETDNSLWQREMYIKKGWEYFLNSPIIGNGLNNFGYLFKEIGIYGGYAHNNFIELLSGLGIIGFIFYYWFHIYLIINLGIMVFKKRKIAILGFTYTTIFTVFEYGIVSYYDRFLGIMLCVAFVILSMVKTEDEYRCGLRGRAQ